MIRSRISCLLLCTIAFISLHLATWAQDRSKISEADKVALAKTGEAIRAAFARGDADAIMKYHHADVVKSLSPTKFLVGRDAVKADLEDSFRIFYLEFEENRVENVLFLDRCAVEISTFTIRGTAKVGGAPFLFKGRSMVVYVRDKDSPTGWASIREVIQPED